MKLEIAIVHLFDLERSAMGAHTNNVPSDRDSSLQDMRIYVESAGGRLEIRPVQGEGTVIEGQVSVKGIAPC